jgi:hypothetical protein
MIHVGCFPCSISNDPTKLARLSHIWYSLPIRIQGYTSSNSTIYFYNIGTNQYWSCFFGNTLFDIFFTLNISWKNSYMWYKCVFLSLSLSPCKACVTHSCHFGGGFVVSSYVKICSFSPKFDISTTIIMGCLRVFPCVLHKFQNKFCTSFLLLVVTFCCYII